MSGRGPRLKLDVPQTAAVPPTHRTYENPRKALALTKAREWADHCQATLLGPLMVADDASEIEIKAAEAARNSVASTSNRMAVMWSTLAAAEPDAVTEEIPPDEDVSAVEAV